MVGCHLSDGGQHALRIWAQGGGAVGGTDEKAQHSQQWGQQQAQHAQWIHLIRAVRHGGQILHDTFPFLCFVWLILSIDNSAKIAYQLRRIVQISRWWKALCFYRHM